MPSWHRQAIPADEYGVQTWKELNFGRTRLDGSNVNATLANKRIHGTFFGQSALAKHALVVEASCTVVPSGSDLVQLSPLGKCTNILTW